MPRSPNIQLYRPQLTSVLSIANRITALISTLAIVGFAAWIAAAALSQQSYEALYVAATSTVGRAVLVCATFAFFLHLCAGIRHLFWDTGVGFGLPAIYRSGGPSLPRALC